MKTLITGIFALLFTLATNAQKSPTKDDVLLQMSAVGDQHNAALESIYNSLLKNPGPLNTNASNQEKLQYLHDIIVSTPPFNPLPAAIAGIRENYVNQTNGQILRSLDKNEKRSFSEITIADARLNAAETEYYNNLTSIIDKYGTDFPNLEKALNSFNESVFQKFGTNSNSTFALIAGSCVAKSSANYWFVNTEKWKQLKSGSVSKSLMGTDDCGGKVLKSDASGAVSGAVGGAVAGAGIGGVGAIPGAAAGAVGGAVTGSTCAAVNCLLGWLFG